MRVLKFTLSGKHAMFKKPDVNSYIYFTYGQIHKPVVLGIFGAILGYAGYNQRDRKEIYPEYYEKLQNIKLSIAPNAPKGYFSKKITYFNNSTGFASHEQGGNLIVKEQWLEEPSWDIYVLLDNQEAEKLADCILGKKSVFLPYMGKNDHPADISNVRLEEGKIQKAVKTLDCLFLKNHAVIDQDAVLFSFNSNLFKYEEALPVGLDAVTNQYILEKFIFTNMELAWIKNEVWHIGNRNIVFY